MLISALFAGKPQAFGPRKSPSSIIKKPYEQLKIIRDGAIEDEQGNKKLHGGPEMALHQYAQKSYIDLQRAFPKYAHQMAIGTIGENISAPDMHEQNVFIGDVYQMGEVELEVASPRAPCSKINHRYGFNEKGQQKIDAFVLEQGICGWYYRVLQEGVVKVGDKIELVRRNENPVSVEDIMFMTKPPKGKNYTSEALKHAEQTPGLAREWQQKIARIARGR